MGSVEDRLYAPVACEDPQGSKRRPPSYKLLIVFFGGGWITKQRKHTKTTCIETHFVDCKLQWITTNKHAHHCCLDGNGTQPPQCNQDFSNVRAGSLVERSGVEYHAMDSDTEDAFYAEPPRDAWPMGSAAERREHPQGLDGPPGNFYLKSSGDFQVFFGVEKKDQVNSYDIMYCHFCE